MKHNIIQTVSKEPNPKTVFLTNLEDCEWKFEVFFATMLKST